jgi:CRP/FNR family cyclic AMP-dependent transcriptional regulator
MSSYFDQWLMMNLGWAQIPGYAGAVFVVVSFMMKTMIPLRIMTILSNICFILYAYLESQYPTFVLHIVLLPLNAVRIYQMLLLVSRVRAASQGEQTLGALKPYMRRRNWRPGQVVFRKGEVADTLYYLVSGQFRVREIGIILESGAFVGELGLLTPTGLRTQTLECMVAGELLSISYEHVSELFYQNPDFGYHFLQITAGRLFQNIEALHEQVAVLEAQLEAGSELAKAPKQTRNSERPQSA